MSHSIKCNRRQFLQSTAAGAAAIAAGARFVIADGPAPTITLPPGPQLFLDDDLIAEQSNLTRVIHPPARLPHPIVTADDKSFQPYVSVIRIPETGRFRLYYNRAVNSMHSHVGVMESDNGYEFDRPARELDDPSGVTVGMGAYVLDHGPAAVDPKKRYVLAWDNNGVYIAFSPDGLNWTAASRDRVFSGNGDIISLSRDPLRNRYLLICKVNSSPEDGYKGSTPNAKEGTRRMVGQCFSDDCINWTGPHRIIVPDAQDEGITEFYSIGQVIQRGGLLIGLLKVLRDDLPAEPDGEVHGIGYTCLAWTRDGQTWRRDRAPFMDRNATPGAWDRAMTWGDCPLVVDDEIFIYYGGYARGHKVERFKERQIGFARMQRDRFVSRRAGAESATLRTPTFLLDDSELTINANVSGELRVALFDEVGREIPGFTFADCAAIRGDSLAHPVQWTTAAGRLKGKPVQMQMRLREADLFAFEWRG